MLRWRQLKMPPRAPHLSKNQLLKKDLFLLEHVQTFEDRKSRELLVSNKEKSLRFLTRARPGGSVGLEMMKGMSPVITLKSLIMD